MLSRMAIAILIIFSVMIHSGMAMADCDALATYTDDRQMAADFSQCTKEQLQAMEKSLIENINNQRADFRYAFDELDEYRTANSTSLNDTRENAKTAILFANLRATLALVKVELATRK